MHCGCRKADRGGQVGLCACQGCPAYFKGAELPSLIVSSSVGSANRFPFSRYLFRGSDVVYQLARGSLLGQAAQKCAEAQDPLGPRTVARGGVDVTHVTTFDEARTPVARQHARAGK